MANAAAWTEAVRGGALESRRLATDAAILQAIEDCRPRLVLDVGCGEGWLVRALAERGHRAVGVDRSAPLLEAALRLGGDFRLLSYDRLDELELDYDLAVCNFSLLDEDPPLGRLRSRLIVQTLHPCFLPGPYQDGERIETAYPTPMPWRFRTLASWHALLRQHGYRLDDLREPAHPHTGQPLSLLLLASRPAEQGTPIP